MIRLCTVQQESLLHTYSSDGGLSVLVLAATLAEIREPDMDRVGVV